MDVSPADCKQIDYFCYSFPFLDKQNNDNCDTEERKWSRKTDTYKISGSGVA